MARSWLDQSPALVVHIRLNAYADWSKLQFSGREIATQFATRWVNRLTPRPDWRASKPQSGCFVVSLGLSLHIDTTMQTELEPP